jgi:glutaminyl-tRNA synthetase
MGVLKPLKVVLTNYPDDLVEEMDGQNHPKNPAMGTRKIPFAKELYIERDDFLEEPPKKFFRLGVGREVRLRYAYFIRCESFVKDEATGEIVEVHCTYDPSTRGGSSPDGRKVKGTIHWVSVRHAVKAEVRLYDRLFDREDPEADKEIDFKNNFNPNSLTVLADARLEPCMASADIETRYQFERQGYFCLDQVDSQPGKLVFNRIVNLRDTWAKVQVS